MDYNLIKVTDETVLSDAGICYFDHIDDQIKEVGESYIAGTNPSSPMIHRFLFVAKNSMVKYLKIKINKDSDLERLFDIKMQPGTTSPSVSSFDDIPNYNELIITDSIQPYSIVPFFVYIKAKAPLDMICNLPLEIEYDV